MIDLCHNTPHRGRRVLLDDVLVNSTAGEEIGLAGRLAGAVIPGPAAGRPPRSSGKSAYNARREIVGCYAF